MIWLEVLCIIAATIAVVAVMWSIVDIRRSASRSIAACERHMRAHHAEQIAGTSTVTVTYVEKPGGDLVLSESTKRALAVDD